LHFTACNAETDIWIRAHNNVYEYVAVFDGIGFVLKDPCKLVKALEAIYGFNSKALVQSNFTLVVTSFKIIMVYYVWH